LILNNSTNKDENSEVAECAQLLQASPPIPFSATKVESLQDESKPSFDVAKAPEIESILSLHACGMNFLHQNL